MFLYCRTVNIKPEAPKANLKALIIKNNYTVINKESRSPADKSIMIQTL